MVVVGAGVIGLACGWRLAREGQPVVVVERGLLGRGTSSVAAGMLAPLAELELSPRGEEALALALEADRRWRGFAGALETASGRPLGLRRQGTLLVARDADEARELDRQRAYRARLGLATKTLTPSAARALEPGLAPRIRLALLLEGEGSVEPRRVVNALGEAFRKAGGKVLEGVTVDGVVVEEGRVSGVRLAGKGAQRCSAVVVCAGAYSGDLRWLAKWAAVPVRPVRGEILRLRGGAGSGPSRTLRAGHVYLVPRLEGEVALGATMEERGFAPAPRAGAVYDLLKEGIELWPPLAELALEEVEVGFRPATPDNLPLVGPTPLPGLFLATGHFRNGILHAPLTADLLAGWLGMGPAEPLAPLCDPRRFAGERPGSATVGV